MNKVNHFLWKLITLLCLFLAQIAIPALAVDEIEFSIQADPSAGAINNCVVLWDHGWIKPTDKLQAGQLRWTGRASINRYYRTPIGFRFIPASNGWATLHIKPSPNAGATGQTRLEINNLTASGADISSNLQQKIRLTAGTPVVIQFTARAFTPANLNEMPRIFKNDTPAHTAIRFFQRGVNLGNSLEAPPDQDWGASYTPSDYNAIKSEGFDHIRIPCAWHHHTSPAPDFNINADFFTAVSAIVTQATSRGLSVIINWHNFDAFTTEPAAHIEQFNRGWEQIASHYASIPGRIAFELLNEPKDAANTTKMNDVYARVIPTIRAKAPNNTLFVGPGRWNEATELEQLKLPAGESNIIVTIHDYDPFLFTHQGASWTAPLTSVTNITFPGPPTVPIVPVTPDIEDDLWIMRWFNAYNTLPPEWNPCGIVAIGKNLRLAKAWSEYYGRPVHVGEWGCIAVADTAARSRYYAAKRRLLNEAGLAWAIWDWKSHFRYWNEKKQTPMPGLRQALFRKDF